MGREGLPPPASLASNTRNTTLFDRRPSKTSVQKAFQKTAGRNPRPASPLPATVFFLQALCQRGVSMRDIFSHGKIEYDEGKIHLV